MREKYDAYSNGSVASTGNSRQDATAVERMGTTVWNESDSSGVKLTI